MSATAQQIRSTEPEKVCIRARRPDLLWEGFARKIGDVERIGRDMLERFGPPLGRPAARRSTRNRRKRNKAYNFPHGSSGWM
jgi:hypothetical protein